MRKTWLAIVLVPCLCLTACTTEFQKIHGDISQLERSQDEMRRRQADLTNDLAALNESVRALSGRLEELEYQQRARVGTDLNTMREEISSLKRRVPPPAMVPVDALEADEALAGKLGGPVGEALTEVVGLIRSGSYSAVLATVEKGLSDGYGQEGAAQLLFWKAVAFDGLTDNRKAIVAYNELITAFPKHDRTALGLLRIASVFIRMGDSRTAKLTLEKLVKDFPKSSEASTAKMRLKDFK